MKSNNKNALIKYIELNLTGTFNITIIPLIKDKFTKIITPKKEIFMENIFVFVLANQIKIFFDYENNSKYTGRINTFIERCETLIKQVAGQTNLDLKNVILHNSQHTFNTNLYDCIHNKWTVVHSERLTFLHQKNVFIPSVDGASTKLKTFDCFSGIGGIAFALKPITNVIGYCEYNRISQNILISNMQKAYLDRASIHPDVNTLHIPETFDLFTAGFPCQGFSALGLKQNFNHPGSGLYYQMTNIIEQYKPRFVFFENVPGILDYFQNPILTDYHNLGYNVFWACTSANVLVGAPHKRERWFMLGVHKDVTEDLPLILTNNHFDFSQEICERTTTTLTKAETITRCQLLGNSVVAPAVAHTWNILAVAANTVLKTNTVLPIVSKSVNQKTRIKNGFSLATSSLGTVYDTKNWSQFLMSLGLSARDQALLDPTPKKYHWQKKLRLDPNIYKRLPTSKPLKAQQKNLIVNPITRKRWGTPLFSEISPCTLLTKRSASTLFTQILFEEDTKNRTNPVNANYVEFMFGYPKDFTAINNQPVDWTVLRSQLPSYKT
jgi:DNA (cytosine-5)-methyltransferase 1